MPAPTLPPFPDNVPTHPLLVIDYQLLQAGDASEIDRLWEAATTIGFWYLKNHGTEKEADSMFDYGASIMELPLEEKLRFEKSDEGPWFGYKKTGTNAVDATGKPDCAEYFSVSKDDVLAYPKVVHATYPQRALDAIPTTLSPFIRKSLVVNNTIFRIFNEKLGLPKGTLEGMHSDEEHGYTATRVIRIPPTPESEDQPKLGGHTDVGSMTILHNRLGGLQVIPPGNKEWSYVKPLPGHAICNVADALAIFSGGILKSSMHRVVRPPGEQGNHERWSIVFFVRAGDSSLLRPLADESPLIAEAMEKNPNPNFNTGQSAGDWFRRRLKYLRLKNRTGPETWAASRGTEHNMAAAGCVVVN